MLLNGVAFDDPSVPVSGEDALVLRKTRRLLERFDSVVADSSGRVA